MRVTSTKPKKYTTVAHYPMHRATVSVRGASEDQLARCAEVAARYPWATRSAYDPCVWEVWQRYEGRPSCAGGADHDVVDGTRERLADEMREACGLEVAP